MFFQWTLASGIFIMGVLMLFFQCAQNEGQGADKVNGGTGGPSCPSLQPLSMLGGVLWASGNIMTVPIVKTIGLSMGLLTWGMASMIMGWASARFGILGVYKQAISSSSLNTVGVLVAVASMVVFAFIRPTVEKAGGKGGKRGGGDAEGSLLGDDEVDSAYAGLYSTGINAGDDVGALARSGGGEEEDEKDWTDALSPGAKKLFGFGASVLAGLLYGVNFNPPTYVANHSCEFAPGCSTSTPPTCDWQPNDSGCYHYASSSAKDHIFSHFTGIWLSATLYFVLYAAATKNTPRIYGASTLPGIVSGMIWAMAQISWFYANADLGQAVAFPIIS